MLIRRLKWITLQQIILLVITVESQEGGPVYDTGEWIPMTPQSIKAEEPQEDDTPKATSRALNLLQRPQERFVHAEPYNNVPLQSPPRQPYRPNVAPPTRPLGPPSGFKRRLHRPYKFDNIPPPGVYPKRPNPNRNPNRHIEIEAQFMKPPPINQPYPLFNNDDIQPPTSQFYSGQNYRGPGYLPKENGQTYATNSRLNSTYEALHSNSLGESTGYQDILFQNSSRPDNEQTVQLVYVPLENLNPPRQHTEESENIYREVDLPQSNGQFVRDGNFDYVNAQNFNSRVANSEKSQLHQNAQDDFIQQALAAHKLQQQINQGQPVLLQTTTTTTQKPKKRKPHQPPLAVYMGANHKVNVKDVLDVLKDAKTISVQDSVSDTSPQVFVGPSNLNTPDSFVKFPLPYLNSIDHNRIGRKTDQLPFFVAPLSYKTPPGYSKIPLPSPHVGSVVISNSRDQDQEDSIDRPYSQPNLIKQYEVKEQKPTYSRQQPQVINTPAQVESVKNHYSKYNIDSDSISQLSEFTGTPKSILEDQINQYIQSQDQSPYVLQSAPNQPVKLDKPEQYKTIPQYSYDFVSLNGPTKSQAESEVNQKPGIDEDRFEVRNQFEKGINQYDLEQINGGFVPVGNVPKEERTRSSSGYYPTSTPETFRRTEEPRTYRITTTTPLPKRTRTRHRNPSTRISAATATTVKPTFEDKDKYTVLEEFSISPKPTPTFSYDSDRTEDQQQHQPEDSSLEMIRGNVYKIDTQRQPPRGNFPEEKIVRGPSITSNLNQQVISRITSQGQAVHTLQPQYNDNATPNYGNNPQRLPENQAPQQIYTDSNGDSYIIPSGLSEINPLLPNLINNLQDQAVRPLLTPTSLVPTTEQQKTSTNKYEPKQRKPSHRPDLITIQRPSDVQPSSPPQVNYPEPEDIKPEVVTYQRPLYEARDVTPTYSYISYPPVTTTTTSTTAAPVETTTTRKLRGRHRGGNRFSGSTSTASPARTRPTRRRPVHSSRTTEPPREIVTTTEYSPIRHRQRGESENDKGIRTSTNSPRQRFRTRGRPLPSSTVTVDRSTITERISNPVQQVTQSYSKQLDGSSDSGFRPIDGKPQSYMHFETVVDDQDIITVRYQDPGVFEEKARVEELHKPMLDVQISHPSTHKVQESAIISQSNGDANYVRFNANIQSGGVLFNNQKPQDDTEQTTKTSPRIKTKPRIRQRPTTTPISVTQSPVSVTSSPTTVRIQPRPTHTYKSHQSTPQTESNSKEDKEEFYGFFRPPTFNKPQGRLIHQQISTTEAPISNTRQSQRPSLRYSNDAQDYSGGQIYSQQPIQFVGEIRPKYQPSTSRHQSVTSRYESDEPVSSVTTNTKTRGRVRISTGRPETITNLDDERRQYSNHKQTYSDLYERNDAPTTRRPTTRTRGNSHYKPPPSVEKQTSEDEDVEGGNYPTSYLVTRSSNTPKPPNFQITIDPEQDEDPEDIEDQLPYSSIFRPNVVVRPDFNWLQDSAGSEFNELPLEDKSIIVDTASGEISKALPVVSHSNNTYDNNSNDEEITAESQTNLNDEEITTESQTEESVTEAVEVVTRKKGRRRGVWKLIRARPLDQFESAETKNYYPGMDTLYEQPVGNDDKEIDWSNELQALKSSLPKNNQNTTDQLTNGERSLKNIIIEEVLNATKDTSNNSLVSNDKASSENETKDLNERKNQQVETTTEFTTTTKSYNNGLLDTLYGMLGMNEESNENQLTSNITQKNVETTTQTITENETQNITATTTLSAVPENEEHDKISITTTMSSQIFNHNEIVTESQTIKTEKSSSTVNPWDHLIKTSTSTEVSHETEICYKGKCVKSSQMKTRS